MWRSCCMFLDFPVVLQVIVLVVCRSRLVGRQMYLTLYRFLNACLTFVPKCLFYLDHAAFRMRLRTTCNFRAYSELS